MSQTCNLISRASIISLFFAALAITSVFLCSSVLMAADNTVFTDPYNGGHKLSPGGGQPGRAYTAFIDAAYKKDHRQLCSLMADASEVDKCLEQKQALDGYIAMLTQPKSQKVLGGYLKGQDATLQVEYTFAEAPRSTGFVVMRQNKGKWIIASFGSSGSGTMSASAGGQTDLAAGQGGAKVGAGPAAEAEYTGPALGKWIFEGKDSKGMAWSGTLTISEKDSGEVKYIDCSLDAVSRDGASNGVGSECTWDAAKREVLFGPEPMARYRALLSTDGRKMTQGTWTEAEKDWNTGKTVVNKTGAWTASRSKEAVP